MVLHLGARRGHAGSRSLAYLVARLLDALGPRRGRLEASQRACARLGKGVGQAGLPDGAAARLDPLRVPAEGGQAGGAAGPLTSPPLRLDGAGPLVGSRPC